MKRSLGRMAMNWLRNPQNQAKVKRTARQFYDRYQKSRSARVDGDKARTQGSTPASPTPTQRSTSASDSNNP